MPAEPFVFKKVVYLVEVTGRRARTLDELMRAIATVPTDSIGYHMHREFLAFKFAPIEYPNDFALWATKSLGDEVLGEKLSSLRVFTHRTLEVLRLELMRLLGEHLFATPEVEGFRSTPERAFHFLMARSVILGCDRQARSIEEMASVLAEIEASSLYFHLFETRFRGGKGRDNDFAEWLRHGLGQEELAARVAQIDPYMFSLEQARRTLVRTLLEGHPRRSA